MTGLLKVLVLGLLATIIAVIAYIAGFGVNYYVSTQSQPGAVAVPAKFALTWEAWRLLKDEFYGDVPQTPTLVHGMIRGMLASLGDSHTILVEPEPAQLEQNNLQGNYGGIGASVEVARPVAAPSSTQAAGFHIVLLPFAGGPAARAGVFANDYLIKVDDKEVSPAATTDDVETLLRGDVGTTVKLTIFRVGDTEVREFSIKREQINIPTVQYRMLPNTTYAYVQITLESGDTAQEFVNALNDLKKNNPTGIVLDLRNNPGGLFPDPALEIAGQFLGPNNPVVIEQYRDGSEKTYTSRGSGIVKALPYVVLVNGGTASAAEILSGALHDSGKTVLIGEKTFGKGSVQALHTLSDDSVLHVTTATWLTPKRNQIDGVGLKPDVAVPFTAEDANLGLDPQLDRAIEYLKNGK